MNESGFWRAWRWFFTAWSLGFLAFDLAAHQAAWAVAVQAFFSGYWLTILAVKRWRWLV